MHKQALILAAEDEETDRLLLKIALQQTGLANPLTLVRDGQETIDYLDGNPPYTNRHEHPLPGLLLLDLKMPRLTGFDVLEWLATRRDFRRLPVVVLSSSSQQLDMDKARNLGARDYLIKPNSFRTLIRMLHEVAGRWLMPAQQAA